MPRVGLRVPRGLERADRADRLLDRPRRRLPDAGPDVRRVGLVGAAPDLHDKDLLYEGYKVVPYCPRCGTALSSHEVAQGYRDVVDPSVYVRFRVAEDGGPLQAGDELLVWTTTPWTLVSNAAVAVDPELTYVRAKAGPLDAPVVLAEALVERVLGTDVRSARPLPRRRARRRALRAALPVHQGRRLWRARAHDPARRLRQRRRRHRTGAHRDRLRRGGLPPRRSSTASRSSTRCARTGPTTSASARTPAVSSRTPTPT